MYAVEPGPMAGASSVAMELPAPGTMRELSAAELLYVSGAWNWNDFYGAMFTGAVGGAVGGAVVGGGAGALPGAFGGAFAGGATYAAAQLWQCVMD